MQLGIPGVGHDVPCDRLPLTPTDLDNLTGEVVAGKCLEVSFGEDYQTFICPIAENMEHEGVDTLVELIRKWTTQEWAYSDRPQVRVIALPREAKGDTLRCGEFGVYIWADLACVADLWSRPFDASPDEIAFSCGYALDCYKGEVYSKDFGYFDCEDCNRCICVQNPSNGWMGQYKWVNECTRVCNKCFEEQMLREGVNEHFTGNNAHWPDEVSVTAFFSTGELSGQGWVEDDQINYTQIGMGYSGYSDESRVKQEIMARIRTLDSEGHLCVINTESMAIGGLGGYLTIWHKPKDAETITA